MENSIFKEIVRKNEMTNVIAVKNKNSAFGKPLKAGSIVIVDSELREGIAGYIVAKDVGASYCINTILSKTINLA